MISFATSILSGGASRRAGTFKALISYNGKPMIARIVEVLLKVSDRVYIVVKTCEQEIVLRRALSQYSSRCVFVRDVCDVHHPAVWMYSLVKHTLWRHDYVFITGCDMMNVRERSVGYLVSLCVSSGCDAVVPMWRTGHIEPLYAVYKVSSLHDALMRCLSDGDLDELSLRDIIKKIRLVRYVSAEELVEMEGVNVFENVNRLEQVSSRSC